MPKAPIGSEFLGPEYLNNSDFPVREMLTEDTIQVHRLRYALERVNTPVLEA